MDGVHMQGSGVSCSPSALLRMRGVLVDRLQASKRGYVADKSQTSHRQKAVMDGLHCMYS